MSRRIINDGSFDRLKARNFNLPVSTTLPTTPGVVGELIYVSGQVFVSNGSSWAPVGSTGIPFSGGEISEPNTYSLSADLSVASGQTGVNITADDVTLNLNGKCIILEDAANQTIAINSNGHTGLKIVNGCIRSLTQSASGTDSWIYAPNDYNWGLKLVSCSDVVIANVRLELLGVGVDLQICKKIAFCGVTWQFADPSPNFIGSGVTLGTTYNDVVVAGCSDISFVDCKMNAPVESFWLGAVNLGYRVDLGTNSNISINNFQSVNCDIFACNVSGLTGSNIAVIVDDPFYPYSLLQLGAQGKTSPAGEVDRKFANGVNLEGVVLTQTAGASGTTTLSPVCCQDVLINNSVISLSGITSGDQSGAVVIGAQNSGNYNAMFTGAFSAAASPYVKQLTLRGCQIKSLGLGIIPLCNGDGGLTNNTVIIDDCVVSWNQNGMTVDAGDNVSARFDLATHNTDQSGIRNSIITGAPTVAGGTNFSSGNTTV